MAHRTNLPSSIPTRIHFSRPAYHWLEKRTAPLHICLAEGSLAGLYAGYTINFPSKFRLQGVTVKVKNDKKELFLPTKLLASSL